MDQDRCTTLQCIEDSNAPIYRAAPSSGKPNTTSPPTLQPLSGRTCKITSDSFSPRQITSKDTIPSIPIFPFLCNRPHSKFRIFLLFSHSLRLQPSPFEQGFYTLLLTKYTDKPALRPLLWTTGEIPGTISQMSKGLPSDRTGSGSSPEHLSRTL